MVKSTETTAQAALRVPDKVWTVAVLAIAGVILLGTQQRAQGERQDEFDENMAKILEVQYTYAIDINTLKITMAGYDSLSNMSDRLEDLIDQLEDDS